MSNLRLVVVPTDPISAYERAGYDWLERYFNPGGLFKEVYALSPLEDGDRQAHGMTIRKVSERQFSRELKAIRPHAVRAYGGFWPSDLVCRNRLPGVPVLVSVHETRPQFVHESLRYADVVISLTEEVTKRVQAVGVEAKRIRMLPNRIDTQIFRPIKNPQLLQSIASRFPAGKHILQVGRKCREKNLDTIIRALAFLPADYSCVFIGRGDQSPFESLARELGVNERCFWIDAVKNAELALWYSWCDCFCLPSRFPSEGFPIVSIEAAACGAPMVISDIPPMNNYMTHDQNACLVKDYENPSTLAEAIRKTCETSSYRERISKGAIDLAKQFDLPIVDAMEVAIYKEAMNLAAEPLTRRLELGVFNTRCHVSKSFVGSGLRRLLRR
jgi:glycosyltransferase involved in cell wall biosynthesis